MTFSSKNTTSNNNSLPESLQSSILVSYRSAGLGLYGALIRFAGMPLEKIALFMNSSQVSGGNQLRQAIHLTFQNGSKRSFFTPYKVVGGTSVVAWFLQYSVMGMVFQICDRAISTAMGVPIMPYGAQLMEDPDMNSTDERKKQKSATTTMKQGIQIILAPAIAGTVESVVSNRAEVQRFYGISKFAQVEKSLKWNPFSRLCGPAFIANSSRNFIMSATSFVITPVLYRNYFPQENKTPTSLFWFGLGVNVFVGNVVAITHQSLWGRSLDYAVVSSGKKEASGNLVARNINYRIVIQEALKNEGTAAFFTIPKWATRVLMNAPVQGTVPWFYNEVLPFGESTLLSLSQKLYSGVMGKTSNNKKTIMRRPTNKATQNGMFLSDENNSNTTATSPARKR